MANETIRFDTADRDALREASAILALVGSGRDPRRDITAQVDRSRASYLSGRLDGLAGRPPLEQDQT